MFRKILSTFAFSMLFGALPLMAQVNFKTLEPKALFSEAKAEGKYVFVDLYADWCPPCKMMNRDVFPKKEVGEALNSKFLSAKYNVDNKTGQEMSRQYGVQSIPTYLIFDGDGKLVGRMAGAMPAAEFIKNIDDILSKLEK